MLGLGLGIPLGSVIMDKSPLAIGSSLAFWYKFNTDQTLSSGSGNVTKWADQSSNGNDAAQSVDVRAAGSDNGALDFERSQQDHYDLDSAVTVAENSGFCLAVVFETETVEAGTILSKDASDQFAIVDADTFRFKSDTTDTTTDFIVSSVFPIGQKMLLLLNRSDGASNKFTLFKDGVKIIPDVDNSVNAATGDNPYGFDLNVLGSLSGTSDFFDGKIYDIAFWDGPLTATEIADVNSYFTSIHGL